MAKRNGKKQFTSNNTNNKTKKTKKRNRSDTLSLWAVVISAISLIYTISSPIIIKHFEEIEHISVIDTGWDTDTVLKYSHNDGIGDNALKEASYVEGFLFSATLANHSSGSVIISDYSCERIAPTKRWFPYMTFIDSVNYNENYGGFPISINANDFQQITFMMRFYIPSEVDNLLFEEYGYNAEVDPRTLLTYLAENGLDLFGNPVERYIWSANQFHVDEYANEYFLPEYRVTFYSSKGSEIETIFRFNFS